MKSPSQSPVSFPLLSLSPRLGHIAFLVRDLGNIFLWDLIGVTLLWGISLEQKSLARKDLITALSAAQLFALTLTLSPFYLLSLPTEWDFQGFSLGHINRRPCIFSSGKQPFAPFPANRWCGKSPIWISTVSAELILHTLNTPYIRSEHLYFDVKMRKYLNATFYNF